MKCLIVAAGQGTRLREKGGLKPLVRLAGTCIIEHVIQRGCIAGVDEFIVVSGYRRDDLHAELALVSRRQGVRITTVVNEDWHRANGVSLYAARTLLDAPFMLTMCDHLSDPGIYRDLIQAGTPPGTVTLAVDYNIDNPLHDLDDVTRVRCAAGKIIRIGKTIPDFNAIDTGTFLCSTMIFDALEESQALGDDSISGAMTVLAGRNRACTHDIGGRLWVDIDDPAAFAKAEHLLTTGLLQPLRPPLAATA